MLCPNMGICGNLPIEAGKGVKGGLKGMVASFKGGCWGWGAAAGGLNDGHPCKGPFLERSAPNPESTEVGGCCCLLAAGGPPTPIVGLRPSCCV